MAILAPGLLLLLAVLMGTGRVQAAHQAVETAARQAARQASISRNPTAAQTTATTIARRSLQQQGVHCTPVITIDTSGLARPVGSLASVSATVTCRVALSDLLLPGLPGTRQIESTWRSPVDPFRGTR
jgi:Flp pilus assembly protein TadG